MRGSAEAFILVFIASIPTKPHPYFGIGCSLMSCGLGGFWGMTNEENGADGTNRTDGQWRGGVVFRVAA